MTFDELIALLRRRFVLLVASLILGVGAVVTVTLALPKTYLATATLFVGDAEEEALDTSQSEQLSRTFTTLASNPAIADDVALVLASTGLDRTELLDRVAFAPVERTPLLQISAEAATPAEAAQIANAYTEVFVDRVAQLFRRGRVPTRVSVSEVAIPPLEEASPNVPLYIGLGSLLALLAAGGAALLFDRLDSRVALSEEDDTFEGLPILSRIPSSPSVHTFDPALAPAVVDAMRVLRTSLELAPGGAVRTVLITSPASGDGKSSLASNLSVAIARDGDEVALLECDLRRPSLDLGTIGPGLAASHPGIADLLTDRADLHSILHNDSTLESLSVVYAGKVDAEPTRLLRSGDFTRMLNRLQGSNRWLIIDAPPLAVGDDALALTPHVDGVILVLDPKRTPSRDTRAGLRRLEKISAPMTGIVLNRVKARRRNSAYDYASGRPSPIPTQQRPSGSP